MRNSTLWWQTLATGILAGTAFTINAQMVGDMATYEIGSWYLRSGIGPEFTADSGLTLDYAQPDARVKFDPGLRVDIAGGCRMGRYISLEGASGVIYNRLDSIAGSPDTKAELTQIPFLANVRFQLPTGTPWAPFAGGGCGFTVNEMNIDHATIQGVDLHGNASAVAFAYQAFAGIGYHLNPRMEFSLSYEFLGATQPEWDVASVFPGGPPGTLVLRHPYTHSVVAAFTFRF